jgi:hypothetical protein
VNLTLDDAPHLLRAGRRVVSQGKRRKRSDGKGLANLVLLGHLRFLHLDITLDAIRLLRLADLADTTATFGRPESAVFELGAGDFVLLLKFLQLLIDGFEIGEVVIAWKMGRKERERG